MKQCITCRNTLPLLSFGKHKGKFDGLMPDCRDCANRKGRARRQRMADRTEIITPDSQECQKCGVVKPASEFYTFSRRKCGLDRYCRLCAAARSTYYRDRYMDEDAIRFKLQIMASQARTRAKRDSLPYAINADYLIEHFSDVSHCEMLGTELDWRVEGVPRPNSPSLDKIIPELGYVPGNVRVISHQANFMKNDASPALLRRFGEWIMANVAACPINLTYHFIGASK